MAVIVHREPRPVYNGTYKRKEGYDTFHIITVSPENFATLREIYDKIAARHEGFIPYAVAEVKSEGEYAWLIQRTNDDYTPVRNLLSGWTIRIDYFGNWEGVHKNIVDKYYQEV